MTTPRIISLIASILLISACVQVQENSTQASRLAVSAVQDMPANFEQGSTFAIVPIKVEHQRYSDEEVDGAYHIYANAITQQMIDRGYTVVQEPKIAKIWVRFALVLEEDVSDATIAEKFGVVPGLPHTDGLEKGSFLVAIEDAEQMQRVWRGAAQGFVHEELPVNERIARTENIVSQVFKQYQPK
ncbi:DUF4136 domain-containing protein [Thalassotalea agarivorans]|uniref:DUF4136 domain-containing protein n=1 Tax=Thalassotalea agarivorans TaxID=349064 RepID=A0A1I0GL26_THASX|nr:DUF4136 domain-containing protein [Thalassotalea agarivorans]SET71753.1 protein of unknown function [Thalassotalea agarivorans]